MAGPFSLQFLDHSQLSDAVRLDQRALGGIWTFDGYQQELNRSSSALIGLVAPQLEQPLLAMGCLWGIEDEAHIILLAVDPDCSRKGLGQTVLWGLLAIASERKLTRATLEVRASNHAALSLYQKFGFQTAGIRKGYYAQTGEDALILWRSQMQGLAFLESLQDWRQQIEQRLHQHNWQPLLFDL